MKQWPDKHTKPARENRRIGRMDDWRRRVSLWLVDWMIGRIVLHLCCLAFRRSNRRFYWKGVRRELSQILRYAAKHVRRMRVCFLFFT